MIQLNSPPSEQLTVWTRMGKAAGSNSRYASDRVRAIPTADAKAVILQATDGHQAVCVLSTGQLAQHALIPAQLMPTRQLRQGIHLHRQNGHWISSEGKAAKAVTEPERFPPVAQVIPAFKSDGKTRKGQPIVLGIDVNILRKVCEALGTSKISLLIPEPAGEDSQGHRMVTQALGVCVANEGACGLAAVMPLKPDKSVAHYEQLRKQVVDAELQMDRHHAAMQKKTRQKNAPNTHTHTHTAKA